MSKIIAVLFETCPYHIICEYQYGTQQCDGTKFSMRECERIDWYYRDGIQTDVEARREELEGPAARKWMREKMKEKL